MTLSMMGWHFLTSNHFALWAQPMNWDPAALHGIDFVNHHCFVEPRGLLGVVSNFTDANPGGSRAFGSMALRGRILHMHRIYG